jgi:hypothetical protein
MTILKANSLQFLFLDRARFESFGDDEGAFDGVFISRVPWELRDRIVRWVFIDPRQRLQYVVYDIESRRPIVTREGWEMFVGWIRDVLDEKLAADEMVSPGRWLDNESLVETQYLLGNANNARHLAESITQLKAGSGAVRQFLKGRKIGGTHVK